MTTAITTVTGVIRGNTISLDRASGLPDGQPVIVTMQPVIEQHKQEPGEGIRRSSGAWADDTEGLDRYLALTRQQRKLTRRELEP